jgi:hypothetical protein
MKLLLYVCLFVAFTVLQPGCSAPETRTVDAGIALSGFPFLRDGKITRSEIYDRLGQPATFYEDGRIVIYWVRENEQDELEVVSKNSTAVGLYERSRSETGYFNLVLVFSAEDILERHSLVSIR